MALFTFNLELIMYRNGKLGSFYGSTLPKIHMISNKASNRSCLKLNFIQKRLETHMSISPQGGGRGLERLIWLKYYFVLKWKNTFNLGLKEAKNTHKSKKASNKSCSKLNFVRKSPRANMSTSRWSGARGLQRSVL